MKYISIFLISFLSLTLYSQSSDTRAKSELLKKLEQMDEIDSIVTKKQAFHYSEKYELYFSQLVDPNDSSAGFYQQRLFLSHTDFTEPMIFVTEGYTADYAEYFFHSNEIATLMKCNQIVAEHRYFGKSWPDPIDWEYLTVEAAAHDHHEIVQTFKELYTDKWITTGISKGGTTSIIHMSLYPDDVDFSVPYVGPINYGLEDGRHEPFIDNISTEEDRKKIKDFQIASLEKRDSIFSFFENYCKNKNYTFRLPLEEIYDYCVLEYSFAFWQWGHPVSNIPGPDASAKEIFDQLMLVSSPSYFAIEEIEPTKAFFVQAKRQLGYYGYDTEPFKELLAIETAVGYLDKIFMPEDIHFEFDSVPMQKVQKFLDENDPKMIFIYGEFDPWSSTGVVFENKENMHKIISPSSSHAVRIGSLNSEQKKFVMNKIQEWLKE